VLFIGFTSPCADIVFLCRAKVNRCGAFSAASAGVRGAEKKVKKIYKKMTKFSACILLTNARKSL